MDNSQKVTSTSIGQSSYLWLIALAALPVVTALASFKTDGDFAIWQLYARQLWLPTLIFEVATIMFAAMRGASFSQPFRTASKTVKLLCGAWFISVVVATGFAKIPNLAVLSLVTWSIHVLFAVAIMYLLRFWLADDRWLNRLKIWIPIGAAVFGALIVLFVALVGMDSEYDWISALPGFPNIRHMGYFLMPALMLSVGAIAIEDDRKVRSIHMALLAVNLGFVIWIGSRGPLLGYLATLALAILLFSEMRQRRTLTKLMLATFAGCLLSQMVPTPKDPTFNAIMRIENDESDNVDQFSSGRTEIWRGAWSAIAKQPVLGHGGNQFRLLVPAAKKNFNQPHNSILQFVFDWGLVGAGALIGLLAILGLRLIAITRKEPRLWLPVCFAAISMAIFSLIDGVFFYNLPIIMFLTFALSPLVKEAMRRNVSAVFPAQYFQHYRQQPI